MLTYTFNKNGLNNVFQQKQSISIIESFFLASLNWFNKSNGNKVKLLLAKPSFIVTPDKTVIQIYYYSNELEKSKKLNNKNSSFLVLNQNQKPTRKPKNNNMSIFLMSKMNALVNLLSRCWNRQVEIRLIRLDHVVLDSYILAQTLALNSHKLSFDRMIKLLKSKSPFLKEIKDNENTSGLTGIKIKLSGRLTTQRSIPRQTIKSSRLGQKGTLTDYSQFTSKNKLGAFTIKVWSNLLIS